MVRRVVGVAERHAVIGDVIFAVLEAADLRLGFGQAGAVGVAVVETLGAISAIWLKSAVAGSESSMKEREMIDCGCVVLSEAVTGAISFALVPVTTTSEPSAIPLFCPSGAFAAASASVGVAEAGAVMDNA